MNKLLMLILTISASLLPVTSASAHVRLEPSETVVGRQVYEVRVPNEKDIPTVKLMLMVPDEVEITGVMPISGWQHVETKISVEHSEEGMEAEASHGDAAEEDVAERITEITWSGGEIKSGEFMLFTFSTKYDGEPKEIAWKAYQTYSDGTVVAWDDSSDTSPAPHVTVLAQTESEMMQSQIDALSESQSNIQDKTDTNTWIAGAALVLSVAAIIISLRVTMKK